MTGPTLAQLAADLGAGRTTARALTEACLDRIADPDGEGAAAFLSVDRDGARAMADAMDRLWAAGTAPSRFAGIPISIKDLFDVSGQVTRAGSRVLDGAAPAREDAPAVTRLRRAGLILIGRTNMTEFAFSGLGLNPHFGTPRNRWRREAGHIPGGSSSGAAVSVTDGMAHAALATDTGGSCRIPAAFNGLVGFKPTAARIPRGGCVPLSHTLDSVGTIARSVRCCVTLDAILAAREPTARPAIDIGALRLLVPRSMLLEGMEPAVAAAFDHVLQCLRDAGAEIVEAPLEPLSRIAGINAGGGFPAAESFAWHRDLIERKADDYDPRVLTRIRRGATLDGAAYRRLCEVRATLVSDATMALAGYDAVLFPTVPILPPRIAELEEEDAAFTRINLLALRNSTAINMIDGCAVSIPVGLPDGPPVGLTLAGIRNADPRILAVAEAVESLVAPAAPDTPLSPSFPEAAFHE